MEIREYTYFKEDEIRKLYSEVGWSAYTDDIAALRLGFDNSLLVLGAYMDGELEGIIRAVGDGYTILFIQDILVRPNYQRRGIGTALVMALLERFPRVRQIQLTCDKDPGLLAFYNSLGMNELSEFGCTAFMLLQEGEIP